MFYSCIKLWYFNSSSEIWKRVKVVKLTLFRKNTTLKNISIIRVNLKLGKKISSIVFISSLYFPVYVYMTFWNFFVYTFSLQIRCRSNCILAYRSLYARIIQYLIRFIHIIVTPLENEHLPRNSLWDNDKARKNQNQKQSQSLILFRSFTTLFIE